MKRACIICEAEIFECMGHVLARDVVACLNGNYRRCREICGMCGLRPDLMQWIIDHVDLEMG
jgi:hypothetical protein